MGGGISCPSDALDPIWMKDSDSNACCNCGGKWTMTQRRHHCRGCGILCCQKCWGEMLSLEEAYGFPGPVPVCTECAAVISPEGAMHILRRGTTVAFTHDPRANVTSENQIPPLANANVKARKFTTNNIQLYHWRPFTKRTLLRLQKARSSREVLRSRSGLTPRERSSSTRDSAGAGGGRASSAAPSGGDTWTIDLAAVESIQLINFSEKDGGEFISISTDFEEHRLQAVTVRFEEGAPKSPRAVPNENASTTSGEAAGQQQQQQQNSNSPSGTANTLSPMKQAETSGGGEIDTTLSPEGPGGEYETASASDRRSGVSSGTRLRTVIMDKNKTRELYNALQRAHQVCQRRAKYVPSEVRAFIEVDIPNDETGSQPTTPRPSAAIMAATAASSANPDGLADQRPRLRHSMV